MPELKSIHTKPQESWSFTNTGDVKARLNRTMRVVHFFYENDKVGPTTAKGKAHIL